jgi:hypothetical protein
MNLPGFSADASLYKTMRNYCTPSVFAPSASVVPQQLPNDGSQLYWCRVACAYCDYGYYCWYCYVCAWFVALGWLEAS